MSVLDAPGPAEPEPSPPPDPARKGCLPALLGLIGVLLLLPGICSLLVMVMAARTTPALWALWLATYVAAAAGIVLIVYVSRKKPPQ